MDSKENEPLKPPPTPKPTEGRSITNDKPTPKPSAGRPITKGK